MKKTFSTLQFTLLSISMLAFSSLHSLNTNPCMGTLRPDLCLSAFSTNPADLSLPEIISSAINHTLIQVQESYAEIRNSAQNSISNCLDKSAINDCQELLELSTTHLTNSISKILDPNGVQDAQALLSAASTNQYTCLEGLEQTVKRKNYIVKDRFKESLVNISNQIKNALAMAKRLPGAENSMNSLDQYRAWFDEDENDVVLGLKMGAKPDLVVAQDGSGNFKTINEALNAAPNLSKQRFVIHIKAGSYFENVEVAMRKKNIMFVGDGMDKTRIKGNRNALDGSTTYNSAVLAVVGEGFIAKDLSVENYAGPAKRQAVALRTNSDRSAFYRCSFIGYQGTLYVHSLHQFFRECDVYGTVDFIFGNSAAVFQKCNFFARKPLPSQKNVFTAQGRAGPDETTGISIMESKIEAGSDFIAEKGSVKSFLGRPWREYSRTVIIESHIGDLIDPAGWLEVNGTAWLSTLYYGEYMNKGPGAGTGGRVKWPGFKVITEGKEAAQFTAKALIQGEEWLKNTTIPHYLGLPPQSSKNHEIRM